MTAEEITLSVETPEPVTIARTIEVRCGRSFVTVRQVMGRTDEEWTVYGGDSFDQGRNKGLQGKINHAPIGRTSEEVIPWAIDLVTRIERAALATAALTRQVDDQPRPAEPDPS